VWEVADDAERVPARCYAQIPVRTEHWDVGGPGWLEVDTVAHCGGSMEGDFCRSVTLTDVHTQWTKTRAVWNKGQLLNYHLLYYFRVRPRPVAFTCSRPYRKNDNARVEQKNWTRVRQLVGYGLLGEPWQTKALNELYAKEWSQFRNFFCPAMKHLRTESEGSKKRRIYEQPTTPFERLKGCPGVDPTGLAAFESVYAIINPFQLKRLIETKLRKLLRQPTRAAA